MKFKTKALKSLVGVLDFASSKPRTKDYVFCICYHIRLFQRFFFSYPLNIAYLFHMNIDSTFALV